MDQGMGWDENGDPKPSLLLDLLSLVPMEKPPTPRLTQDWLRPGPSRPPTRRGSTGVLQVDLFTNILMSHLLLVFPFSAFVGRGRR